MLRMDASKITSSKWKSSTQIKNSPSVGLMLISRSVAEKRIRDLQDMARMMLLHAQRRWPQAITIHLWPYALQKANDVHNSTPKVDSTQSSLELFSQVSIKPTMRHFYHFSCPVYVLHEALQAGCKTQKWEHQSWMGVYLGLSPQPTHSVGLVLSLHTCARASPLSSIFHSMTSSKL